MKSSIILTACLYFALVTNLSARQSALDWVNSAGSNGFDSAFSLAVDSHDDVYIGGEFMLTVDFDPGPGATELTATVQDPFIAKYTAAGDLLWARHLSGRGRVTHIALDSNDDLIAVGWFSQPLTLDNTITLQPEGQQDLFMLKLNSAGDVVWGQSIGALANEVPTALAIDSNNNFVLALTVGFEVDLDPGPGITNVMRGNGAWDAAVAKYDSNGAFAWGLLFEQQQSSTVSQEDFVGHLLVDANDNVVAAGQFLRTTQFGGTTLTSTTSDAYITKISPSGSVMWAQSTNGPGLRAGNLALGQDANGHLYTAGLFLGEKDFDPDVVDEAIANTDTLDMFVSSYTENGDFRWLRTVTGSGVAQGFDVLAQSNGAITVAGQYSGTVDFDTSGAGDERTAQAGWDSYFNHYDSDGNVISVQTLDGTRTFGGEASAIEGLAETADGALLIAGHQRLGVDFDPGPGPFDVIPNGGDEIFVARYGLGELVFASGFETPSP